MQWVKLPPKVYFEKNSIRYLDMVTYGKSHDSY